MKPDFSALLEDYRRCFPDENLLVRRYFRLLENPQAFHRSGRPGHFTASALVLDETKKRTLLVEHRKLGIWVQPGGHADGNRELWDVARRELKEETGITSPAGSREILDLDIHPIPERGRESAHDHYDVRFLFIAGPNDELHISDESTDLRWIAIAELQDYTQEDSIWRMLRKAGAVKSET